MVQTHVSFLIGRIKQSTEQKPREICTVLRPRLSLYAYTRCLVAASLISMLSRPCNVCHQETCYLCKCYCHWISVTITFKCQWTLIVSVDVLTLENAYCSIQTTMLLRYCSQRAVTVIINVARRFNSCGLSCDQYPTSILARQHSYINLCPSSPSTVNNAVLTLTHWLWSERCV